MVYLLALAASHVWRAMYPHTPPVDAREQIRIVRAVDGDGEERGGPVRISYLDLGDSLPSRPVVVLVHGSPGDHGEVRGLGQLLSARYRVIAPDLPGFGGSTREVPDYSIVSHARYLLQLLDSLGIREAHHLGFSMGGGVVLHMADLAPERTRSLIMLSAIGGQEYELLGDYYLNHAIHGLQLAGLWVLHEGVPHFGAWDGAFLSLEYARNFYDTDQRPLRGILTRWQGPMLVIQGDRDPLVQPAAAVETHRLVPQSEMLMLEGDHFMSFLRSDELAVPIEDFIARAEAGTAPRRVDADPDRVREAAAPLDRHAVPPASGLAFVILLLLLAVSTLGSEDLTCIAAGLLVARGTVAFLPATIACLVGIVCGDLLLFLAGRTLGRRILGKAPFRWLVDQRDVERSSTWFRRRGAWIVFASRFLPGTRLPTYLAAGILHTSALTFTGVFFLAALVWTPVLVGFAAVFGAEMLKTFVAYEHWAAPTLALCAAIMFLLVKLVVPLGTWRGRRLLLSRWRRVTRWEYWPAWAVYPPVVAFVLWRSLRSRCLTLFTCVNPGIPGGGFAGESKADILRHLSRGSERVARFAVLAGYADDRMAAIEAFRAEHGLDWPVVLKPDIGERGGGVAIVRSPEQAREYLARAGDELLVQEYVPGLEYGVFWYAIPGEDRGHLFSITDKRFPAVVGDGRRTLEELILADDREVGMARAHLRRHATRAYDVPATGEIVSLVEVGTHARGATFYDGTALRSPALEAAIEETSRAFPGFWFGRYDVRTPSVEAFQAGEFRVIELNGATSEATSMYDPRYRLRDGWRTLLMLWKVQLDIAVLNRRAGAQPMSLGAVWGLLARHREARRWHVA